VKKILLTTAFVFLTSAFIYSQGLNFTGDLVTGFVFMAPGPEIEAQAPVGGQPGEYYKESTDVRLKGESVDAPTNQMRLIGEFDGGNYGIKFRLNYDFDSLYADIKDTGFDAQKTFTWGMDAAKQCAWVWGDFFYNALRLCAGKIGDNVWNTTLMEKWGLEEYNTGFRAEIKPGYGISAGVLLKIPPQYVAAKEQYTFSRLLSEMIIGARYDNSILSAALAVELDGRDNLSNGEQALAAGFMYRGRPGLQAGFEAKMQNLGWSKDFPFDFNTFSFQIMQMAGYDFSSSFYGRIKIYEKKKTGQDFFIVDAYPFMIYKFNRWMEVGGEIGFGADSRGFADSWYFALKPLMYYHLGAYATLGAYWYNKFVHCYTYTYSADKYDPFYTEFGLVFYWSF